MKKYISKKNQDKLYKMFENGCKDIEIENEYWVCGGDESLSYCYDCCVKRVNQLKEEDPTNADEVDVGGGGNDSESDSIAFCCTCDKLLENSLTYYGAKEELDHFLEYGFSSDSESDCYSMMLVVNSFGWRPWTKNVSKENEKRYEKLHLLCRKILEVL